MQIYAACLASDNAGLLHGAWIDAEQDADDVRADIAKVLRASPYPNVRVECPLCDEGAFAGSTCHVCKGAASVPSAEGYAIHDYEGFPESFGEFTGIDKVAGYAVAAGDMSEEEREGFDAWPQSRDRGRRLSRQLPRLLADLRRLCRGLRGQPRPTAFRQLRGGATSITRSSRVICATTTPRTTGRGLRVHQN